MKIQDLIKWTTLLLSALPLHSSESSQYEEIADQSGLQILTPLLAKRQSAKLKLNNGLEVYLISDPGIEQSAAALAVEVGSWQDPKEYPGMAHFLEHMLFMGNEAYPDESEYMRYISDNGGIVNAYTASDRTVYMFSVNNESFEGALDRFSHFFIDPLFNPSSISRELHAVDQEHAKNIENDGWRQYMIFKEIGNTLHPHANFSTGNTKTLKGIPQEAMRKWYQEHYSAHRMHLIILSSLPMKDLTPMVVERFSKVPKSSHSLSPIQGSMTTANQWGHVVYIKPVKDLKVLTLTWELPLSCAMDQETKASALIAYVLESSAPSTLKSTLKKAELIEDLEVSSQAFSKENKLFCIEIQLTETGLQELNRVIQYCFAALAQLRKTGIPRYIFDEVRTMAQLKYQYQSRQVAFDFVKEQAGFLVEESLSTYPLKTLLPTRYDAALIQTHLNFLTPENCIFSVMADPQKTQITPKNREKWMGAEYSIITPTHRQVESWKVQNLPVALIELPPINPYMPTELTEHLPASTEPSTAKVVPQLIADKPDCRIYFAKDHYYLVPEIAHAFRIHSPLLDGTARSKVLMDLYLKALHEKLLPSLSMAQNAGLNVELSQEYFQFAISISGFRSKASDLVKEVFTTLKNVHPTQAEFELYRSSLIPTYENSSKELPFVQAYELLNSVLYNCCPTNAEKALALTQLNYEDFIHFSSELFQKTYVEGLFYGDLSSQDAEQLWESLKGALGSAPYLPSEQITRKVLVLPQQSGPFLINQKTSMQGNAAFLLIEEGAYRFDKRAAQQVLARVLKEDFFDTLRTKQQTAYIARSWASEEEGHLLHYFMVQSNSHQPSELIARFELFLESFLKHFSTRLPMERFEHMRKMLIANLQMRPENLPSMSKRLLALAFDYNGDFDLIDKRISSLEALTYSQLPEYAESFFSRINRQRLAILTEGVLPKENTFRYETTNQDLLRGQGNYLAWK